MVLLGQGSDVSGRDDTGRTAVHWAARHGHDAVVRLLVDRGANVNDTAFSGVESATPLLLAIENEHEAATRRLLRLRARFNIPEGIAGTALGLPLPLVTPR